MVAEERFDRGRATRERVIKAATSLFATQGYEAVSIDAVLEAARVSRGSLYYHFQGKGALFEAVLERQEERIRETVLQAVAGIEEPAAILRAGCHAWLRMGQDPVIRRIVLIDAPSVVGWEKWREIDGRNGFGLLKVGLHAMAATGLIQPALVETLAHVLLAALIEVAMVIARAEDVDEATKLGQDTIDQILNGVVR
jgi:AcrR family transcriptional regulator